MRLTKSSNPKMIFKMWIVLVLNADWVNIMWSNKQFSYSNDAKHLSIIYLIVHSECKFF